jgi:hypothetical protein
MDMGSKMIADDDVFRDMQKLIQKLTPEQIYVELKLMRGRMDALGSRLDALSLREDTIGWKNRAAEAAQAARAALNHVAIMVQTAYRLPRVDSK